MEDLIVQFVTEYPIATTVVTGLVAAHALALFIVNLTPTPKDNEIVGKVYTIVEWVAGIVSSKSKEQ